MKRLKKLHSAKIAGFTLVELLLVIAVIIILTTIGLVVYTNVQRSARDAKRKADIKAIVTALETQYATTGTYTTPLTGQSFSSGNIPTPLEGGSYITTVGENSSGFEVCAALENHPAEAACNIGITTCYCIQSIQEQYIATTPLPTATPTPATALNITRSAGSAASVINIIPNTPGPGNRPWNLVGNIFTEDDVFANSLLGVHPPALAYTNYLSASNFGFSIPAGATINGIQIDIKKKGGDSGTWPLYDDQVKIVKNGTMGSVNKADPAPWLLTAAYTSYGGASDLWGETWTPTDINNSTFGMYLSTKSAMSFVYVDVVKITVHYTN